MDGAPEKHDMFLVGKYTCLNEAERTWGFADINELFIPMVRYDSPRLQDMSA